MDETLRDDLLALFDACLAQIHSGKPGPSFLTSKEFAGALISYSNRLRATPLTEQAEPIGPENLPHLIVQGDPASGRDGFTRLRQWLSGAKEVIICDPYFFHFRPGSMFETVDDYAKALVNLLPPSATKLNIYSNGYTASVRATLKGYLKEGRKIQHFSSQYLHDRFVIKDQTQGKIIGTSFGGFGNKFFTILDLPDEDVRTVRTELQTLCPLPIHRNRPWNPPTP